jgi:hypothetical protein
MTNMGVRIERSQKKAARSWIAPLRFYLEGRWDYIADKYDSTATRC